MSSPVDPQQARIGTTLRGKWKLERLLGEGGMAAVYLAVHNIGRREAIKILHREIADYPDIRARFEQEAHAVNRLKHPGAVAIHDIDETEDGAPFLVMELLEGESLAARLEREKCLPHEEVLRIVDELLDVLVAAHSIGIIHRDIKPDNLFLLPDGRLKVLDFGIARLRDGAPSRVKTRLGAMLGTPNYMPPEQVKAGDIDHRVDLFATGAVMFELVAGHEVHEAESDAELLALMLTEPAPPLARAVREAPPDLCKVVDRALSFEADQRYPDAQSMQEDIRALREGRPPPHATAWLAGTPVPVPPATKAGIATRADAPPRIATLANAPPSTRADAPAAMGVAPALTVASARTPTPAPTSTIVIPQVPPVAPSPTAASGARRQRTLIIAAAIAFVVLVAFVWLAASGEDESDASSPADSISPMQPDREDEPPQRESKDWWNEKKHQQEERKRGKKKRE